MGKEARRVRDRKCPVCEHLVRANSQNFAAHVGICRRLDKIGLDLGGQIERPKVDITYKKVKKSGRDWS